MTFPPMIFTLGRQLTSPDFNLQEALFVQNKTSASCKNQGKTANSRSSLIFGATEKANSSRHSREGQAPSFKDELIGLQNSVRHESMLVAVIHSCLSLMFGTLELANTSRSLNKELS